MKWIAKTDKHKVVIEKQLFTGVTPNTPDQYGYYVFIFEGEKMTHDYL